MITVVPGIGSRCLCYSEVVVVVFSLKGILILVVLVVISEPGVLCQVLGLGSFGGLEVVCHQVDAGMTVAVAMAVAVSLLALVPRRQILSSPASAIDTAACNTEKRVICLKVAAIVVLVCSVVVEEPEAWFANRNTADLRRQVCVMSTIMTYLCILYILIFVVFVVFVVFIVIIVIGKVDIFANVVMMKTVAVVASSVVAAVGVSV